MKTTLALLAFTGMAGVSKADTMYWIGGIDTQWGNSANWLNHKIPGVNDVAVITAQDAGPLIQGFTYVAGLWIQHGANLTSISQFYVNGSATIDGSLSLAGQPAVFAHRDDVNMNGSMTMWDGASVSRLATGSGNFNVTSSGVLTIPSYDTIGSLFGTGLHVYGQLILNSTHPMMIGQRSGDMSSSAYMSVENFGQVYIEKGCQINPTNYPGSAQPFIVNTGGIYATGTSSDTVDINVGLQNSTVMWSEGPNININVSFDVDVNGTLVRGDWVAQNQGHITFPYNSVTGFAQPVVVQMAGYGAALLSQGWLSNNYGQYRLYDGATMFTEPGSGYFVNHGNVTLGLGSDINVAGEFYNASDGSLTVQVAGEALSQHGQIYASELAFEGTMEADIQNSYAPPAGTLIEFAEAGSFSSGQFSQFSSTGSTVPFTVQYDFGKTSLLAGCPSDFNGDGFTDFFDFTDFVNCFEGAYCPPGKTADFNGDGFADFFDFTDFVEAFENGC